MNLLGNKVQVRKIAKRLGIPVVPGSEGAVDVPAARKVVDEITLPIMLKAEGGGGGGAAFSLFVKKADPEDAFLKRPSAMAQASFGNPRLYVEKYLEQVRHIEIQVIADQHGNVFAFDERDCSVQRNHQKLVDVTPLPVGGHHARAARTPEGILPYAGPRGGLLLPRHGGVPRHSAG